MPCYGIVPRVKVHFYLDPRLLEDVAWFQTRLNHVCLSMATSVLLWFLEHLLLNSCICHKLHYCLEFYSNASQLFLQFHNILNCSDSWFFRHIKKQSKTKCHTLKILLGFCWIKTKFAIKLSYFQALFLPT